MKTVLITTIGFILCCTAWLACKKDDPAPYPNLCPAASAFVFRDSSGVLALPTAFTPDNNGLNDRFSAIPFDVTIADFSLTISAGADAILYHSTDVNGGWDGNYVGGQKAPAGIYNVQLKFTTGLGKTVDTCNTVTLLTNDPARQCIDTHGATLFFADQFNNNPSIGFSQATRESICP